MDANNKYPSFKAQTGRDPIPGKDYNPDGDFCQDDYEYYSGTGRYSDEIKAAAAALGRKGGKSKSDAKISAARTNGKQGGRPELLYDSGEMEVGGSRDREKVYHIANGIRVDYDSLYSDVQPGSRYYWEGNYPNLPANWNNRETVEIWFYHLYGSHKPDRVTHK